MIKEVPKILCVTRAVLCEKFKVGGSIARALIKDLARKQLIKPVGQQHSSFDLYQGVQAKTALEKAADDDELDDGEDEDDCGEDELEDICECIHTSANRPMSI